MEDNLLAYRFVYPVKSASGRELPIIFSRRPERYSSAAPLSVDARQRIVASLTDLQDAITVTVSVRSIVAFQNERSGHNISNLCGEKLVSFPPRQKEDVCSPT